MRQGSFTLDNLMRYIYGEQISKIPAKLYNDDAQVKYLDFGSLYTYCCHGSKEHQIRRWLRERIAYVDSMLGYFTSQEDQVTIRMNKTGKVSFEVTPYIPLYFSVKWSNATGGTQTFKLKRGETKTFNYSSTTSTDQEVIIYHAKYIKRLDNLSNLNPSSCILSNAVKLTNVEIHSSELYNINVTNNKFLRSINLENCTALGTVTATGSSLNLSNCKYLRYCNVYNTHLTEVQLNTSGGSLTEIYYPKSIQSINLVKQRLLELIGLPYGYNNIIPLDGKVEGKVFEVKGANSLDVNTLEIDSNYLADSSEYSCWTKATDISNLGATEFDIIKSNRSDSIRIYTMNSEGKNLSSINSEPYSTTVSFTVPEGTKYLLYSHIKGDVAIVSKGDNEFNLCTSLYTISIQECPSIKRLNTSRDTSIASSFAAMVYVNNLTIRNSLDLASLKFDGFHRLQNVTIENMYNLEEVGFNNLLPVGETSTIKYIGMSNCPKLGTIELNCTSNDYEITFADDAILNFGGLFKLNSITSNCVLKGIKTIVVPINLESMFFTNEYGSGYSTIENIWVSSQCNVDTQATTPIVTHVDSTYSGIDFLGMNLKNIDLGALVNIPKAINFKLSPTTVNPHFNLNRDGETYKYLQPVGTLDLSNYTESLAKFFDGVDLDKLEIICNNNLPQTDLSYCFYNSSFSTNEAINKLLTKVSSITNLDYCFYKTTIDSVDILDEINMGASSSMNYTFAECPNIKTLNNVVIPSKVTSVEGMFNKCPLTTITNMIVNVRGSISGLFKGCNKLTTITTLRIPNVTDVSNTFDGCTSLSSLSGFELPSSCTNVSNLFNGCYMLTELGMNFSSNITAGDNWYPPNLETLHDTTISNDYVKLTNCTTLKTLNGVNISGGDLSDLFNGCINLVNINSCTFNATKSLARAFKGCSKITINPITTIVDTVTDISEMYSGCTGITDISGMIIGSGITNATDWIAGSNITNANNVTIKNNLIKFTNYTALATCLNLDVSNVSDMKDFFSGCSSLTNISLYPPSSVCDMTKLCYRCSSLTNIEYLGSNKMKPSNMSNGFREIGKQFNYEFTSDKWDFSNCSEMTHVFYGNADVDINMRGAKFTALKKVMQPFYYANVDFTGSSFNFSHSITSKVNSFFSSIINLILDNCTISGKLNQQFKYLDDDMDDIKTVSMNNITLLDDLSKDWSNMFCNCIKLTSDVVIPSSVTNCTNTFKNCTKMTHIHSNWNNTYDNEITSTNCYAGCTGITHVDDENVIYNEYSEGLDQVPVSWGGYGFSRAVTGIYEITTTTDNYTWSSVGHSSNNPHIFEEGTVNWGDGNITTGTAQHVYKKAGTYIIKGKIVGNYLDSNWGVPGRVVTKIIQLPNGVSYYSQNSNSNLINLTYINLSGIKLGGTASGILAEASKLTTIEGLDSVDTSECWNLSKFFYKCTSLTSIDLSSWDVGNVTNCQQMFGNCTSLASINLSGWNIGKNVSLNSDGSRRSVYLVKMFENIGRSLTNLNISNWTCSDTCTLFCDYMFSGVTNLSSLDFSTWKNCCIYKGVGMFNGMTNLQNILGLNNLNMSICESLYGLFQNCTSLTTLDLSSWNTSNVTDMSVMFQNCKNLQTIVGLENLDMSKVTNFTGMFNECASLTEINLPTTNFNGKNIRLSSFAQGTKSLTTLDLTNWTNAMVTGDLNRFLNYSSVTSFDVSTLDATVLHIGYFLPTPTTLQEFKFFKSLSFTDIANYNPFQNFSLVEYINLSKASLVNFLKVLPDISSSGKSYAIPLGDINLAKLTSSEIAIATNKGYTVV